MHEVASGVMNHLAQDPKYAHSIQEWASIATAIAIISNRESPLHRDVNGLLTGFDLLTTIGPYTSACLCLPSLKIKAEYRSGSVAAFSGRLVRHGVSQADGPRLCHTWYMHEKVFSYAHAEEVPWRFV